MPSDGEVLGVLEKGLVLYFILLHCKSGQILRRKWKKLKALHDGHNAS